MENIPLRGPLTDASLVVIEEAGILVRNGKVEEIGRYHSLASRQTTHGIDVQNLDADYVALPGFIDVHTHMCFGGNRSGDYAMRIAGKTYQEIASSGGGIWDTVTRTRRASFDNLNDGLSKRAQRHLREGVTTCEVKSGYGLNLEAEIKMLEVIRAVNEALPIDLVSTCLAAHIKPRDFSGDEKKYLDFVLNEILPEVESNHLSSRVDIFVEEGAFGVAEAKSFLERAKAMGFNLAIHADQFTTGGSALATEVGADSADHLEASTWKEIDLLSKSNVMPVALPGASLGLGCPFTPARKLLDNGTSLVIASDWNPGSAPMGDLLMLSAVLGAFEKLTTTETFASLTCRAASALRLTDRGMLVKGMLADMIAFPTNDYRDILYNQGKLKPARVWKRGELVANEEL
jgi:imidazolonepropionase